ncbi:MAG: prepilin-type N-terminal cleavage/methylation domain-containing protein [Rickettsiales bacterium]|nr:prepilin-type N-terminal cleavage/methylation domain-containing protein [Rickettsiales bacterium]
MNSQHNTRNIVSPQSGFSLLELSVVLIVIGLLTGGVVAGMSIRNNAILRGILDDVQKYTRAVDQFREKYNQMPGDMINATEIWGAADGGTGNTIACYNTDSTGSKATCNGNGDGKIECPIPNAAGDYSNIWYVAERFRSWQHLANAGFVEGGFSGKTAGATSDVFSAGVNVPSFGSGDIRGAVNLNEELAKTDASNPDIFAADRAYPQFSLAFQPNNVPPKILYALDQKVDDGRPGTGNVTSTKSTSSWQPGCTTTDIASTSLYNTTSDANLCGVIIFKVGK